MARLKADGISGVVGHLVFYVHNGKACVKSRRSDKGKKVREKNQTSTQKSWKMISHFGTPMIEELKYAFLFHFSQTPFNMGRKWLRMLYQSELEHADLLFTDRTGIFPINPPSDIREYCRVKLSAMDLGQGNIAVRVPPILPERDLRLPPDTKSIRLKFVAVNSTFSEKRSQLPFVTLIHEIPNSINEIPAAELVLQTGVKKGYVIMLAVCLEYLTGSKATVLNDSQWLPAGFMAMGKMQ